MKRIAFFFAGCLTLYLLARVYLLRSMDLTVRRITGVTVPDQLDVSSWECFGYATDVLLIPDALAHNRGRCELDFRVSAASRSSLKELGVEMVSVDDVGVRARSLQEFAKEQGKWWAAAWDSPQTEFGRKRGSVEFLAVIGGEQGHLIIERN